MTLSPLMAGSSSLSSSLSSSSSLSPAGEGEGAGLLWSPLVLRCGSVLAGRVVKAAMTEGVGDAWGHATEAHVRLYGRWAAGGACGVLVTGNVMVDRGHVERPGNVCVVAGDAGGREALRAWAEGVRVASGGRTQLWMQVSHPGRQAHATVNGCPRAAGSVPMAQPWLLRATCMYATEVAAMSAAEVERTADAMAHAASEAKRAGFGGVQVHCAHGYLLSSFLNPSANDRGEGDPFGGAGVGRRAAALRLAVARVKQAVGGDGFAVSVKLNSEDFVRNGLSVEDSVEVAMLLDADGVDVLEVSGGNYEAADFFRRDAVGPTDIRRTRREAYYHDYCAALRAKLAARPRAAGDVGMRLMLTGGFRTRLGMEAALASGDVDLVGVARPMVEDPRCIERLHSGEVQALPRPERGLRVAPDWLERAAPSVRVLSTMAAPIAWFYARIYQLAGVTWHGIGPGKPSPPSALLCVLWLIINEVLCARRLRGVWRSDVRPRWPWHHFIPPDDARGRGSAPPLLPSKDAR